MSQNDSISTFVRNISRNATLFALKTCSRLIPGGSAQKVSKSAPKSLKTIRFSLKLGKWKSTLSQKIDVEQNTWKSIGLRKVSASTCAQNGFHLEGFLNAQNELKWLIIDFCVEYSTKRYIFALKHAPDWFWAARVENNPNFGTHHRTRRKKSTPE